MSEVEEFPENTTMASTSTATLQDTTLSTLTSTAALAVSSSLVPTPALVPTLPTIASLQAGVSQHKETSTEKTTQKKARISRKEARDAKATKERILELELQQLKATMTSSPPRAVWARRGYPPQRTRGDEVSGLSQGSSSKDVDPVGESEDVDMEVGGVVGTQGSELVPFVGTQGSELVPFVGTQGSELVPFVDESLGASVGRELSSIARHMKTRHKAATVRQYGRHIKLWKVPSLVFLILPLFFLAMLIL